MSKIGHNGGPVFQSDAGFVAIFRSMRSHPVVGFHLFAKPCDANKGAVQPALAFIDLIMECRYEDGFVMNGGRKMEIRRGQLVGAVSWLAARWNWTPMAVRVWLDKLEAEGMISRFVPGASNNNKHKGKVATILTLCNYDNYQSATAYEQLTEQQTNSKQATNEQQQYKDNNLTNKQIPPPTRARADARVIQAKAFDYWTEAIQPEGAYNASDGFFRDPGTGVLQLINGVRATWVERFGGDERALELALIKAAPHVKPNDQTPLRLLVEAQLAKQLAWQMDDEKKEKAKKSAESPSERRARLLAEARTQRGK